jgi:NADP-dependent 3-hydroxy acid dehydrogenase YdfG
MTETHRQHATANGGLTPLAVISGAGSGIGREAARALARSGYRLALTGRRSAPLVRVLEESKAGGLTVAADVRDAAALGIAAERIGRELGAPSVVLAAAGVAPVARFEELSPEAFRSAIETNLIGSANLFRAFLPAMREAGAGTLVAILSVAARRVFPGWSAYCASKWGLLGLVETLRAELAGSGVRVLALTPGATATPLWDGIEGEWDRSRMIPPSEVARALLWALEAGERVQIEEIRLQPPGGDL